MYTIELVVLLVFVAFTPSIISEDRCPNKCNCISRNGIEYNIIKCGNNEKLITLDSIDFQHVANNVIHLNLSDNLLSSFYVKVQLLTLQKLDLSKNQISQLIDNQFSEIPNLRRLDVSYNNIKTISLLAFNSLNNLERLKLNQNKISSIGMGTFNPLISLKQLDISNNPLTCDCSLLWLLDWTQKASFKLVSNPKCNLPISFKGLPLRKLKVGVDIHCKTRNNGLPLIEMKPDKNQVVFEGDSLNLNCYAPSISDFPTNSDIEWTWLDSNPKSYFNDLTVENNFLQSTGLIYSTLKIPQLKRNHTGIWNCSLISLQGNYSKGITIIVISNDTNYCPITVTMNNKGTYTWPRTIVNYTASNPCESVNENYDILQQKVTYFCSENGQWEQLNTSSCAYISETTRIFEQFSKVNSSIIESAKHFKNFTSNLNHFKGIMDFVYAVKTIINYSKYLTIEQIGAILIDVTNNILKLSKNYLIESNDKNILSSLVNISEQVAGTISSSYLHKSNIALEVFPVKRTGFSGLKCSWYIDIVNSDNRQFYCVTNNPTESPEFHGKITEGSITIPETLFYDLEELNYNLNNKPYNILISMHSTNKLFPVNQTERGKKDVKTAVIGAKLVNFMVMNLTDPIFIMLRTHSYLYNNDVIINYTPVWWNPLLNNGTGDWSSEGCEFSHEYREHIIFFCHQFGYYGLLQDILEDKKYNGAKFKFSHPAIYIGSIILFLSLLISIITYLFCFTTIQMPKKAKHSLINIWISIALLCFFYVFGIYQTEDLKICQIVGLSLHYLTLSSLLWICVSVNCMYKNLNKNNSIIDLQDDELSSDQPIKKPIAGLYFVGWGVGMIVCGISAAINIKDYLSSTYCFLKFGPPLGALYIPSTVFLFYIGILFLLIRCSIYNIDANGHLSEGTQATENVDLDLLEPNFPNNNCSIQSTSTKTYSEIEDPEHSHLTQLKAYIIFLIFYLLSWFSCAFTTAIPQNFPSYSEDLFSNLFAISATFLGIFIVFFYCLARNDVRTQWINLMHWFKRQYCYRTRNISDTTQNLQTQIQIQSNTTNTTNIVADIMSRSSSQNSSSHTKSSNILKGAVDLNTPCYSDFHTNNNGGTKINNVNLIVLHRQQYRNNTFPHIIENPTNAAEVFYNPHQSTVARKFFRRQKRHINKRNNLIRIDQNSLLDFKQTKTDNSSLDHSGIFSTNSKVNNTNIHVELIQRKHKKNPNLFSDSGDDCDLDDVPIENIVINAEKLRKKEISKHRTRKKHNNIIIVNNDNKSSIIEENNMRSVSQQCTLEYSSENLSDSILDKATSPDQKFPSHQHHHHDNDDNIIESESISIQHQNSPNKNQLSSISGDIFPHCSSHNNEPSDFSLSIMGSSASGSSKTVPQIYINPNDDLKKVQTSRASSVSVSDLDELYQQIRHGNNDNTKVNCNNPSVNNIHKNRFIKENTCLSDSDINSYISDIRYRSKAKFRKDNYSDVETTV